MVLHEQIEALLDYLEGHQELALGHLNKTKEGRSLSKRMWVECANILNGLGPDCPTKTPEDWRAYYNEYKFKTLKKIKAQKAEQGATGGGVATKHSLSTSQERLYNILGRDVGDPLPGVRHNPLSQDEVIPGPVTPESPRTNNVIVDCQVAQEDSCSMPAAAQITGSAEPTPGGSAERVRPPKRRRQQKSLEQQTQDLDRAQLESFQIRLERIEERHAEAALEQARAMIRMAAALELVVEKLNEILMRVADRLSEPLTVIVRNESPPKKHREE